MSGQASEPEETDLVHCEGHGDQPVAFACIHLAQSQPGEPSIGFHWSSDEGDLMANCDACEAEVDEDGFLPEDYFTENFVALCRQCFVEIAADNGVDLATLEAAEQASSENVQ